ncbi:uncharacterized protein LOC135348687 isoform X2 [Halichondria panicea]|uniref:uncharacterized protein LOC135348687 isoform X2 n=1 Tax=Halichondria panicea TaxID=6063 RepID=UPI00312B39EC
MSGVFFGLGLTGIAGGQFLYITGAYILPADIASAFQPLIPVWTTLIAIATCTEKMPSLCMLHSWAKIIGVFVATGGAVRLALAGYEPEAEQIGVHVSKQAVGYLCLVMETMLGAMYYIIQKKFVYQVEDCKWKEYPMAMTGYAYLFGCVYEGLFCLYFVVTGQFDAFHLPRQSVPALVYAVFMTSAFCYFLISWSNKYLPSSVMTAFWPVQVVTTAVTAYVLLGDTLTPTQLLSASVIIAGLAMVIYSNRVDEKISKTGEGGIRLDSCYGHHKSNGS